MHKGYLKLGGLLAALAVILGAFGAHGLKPLLNAAQLLTFETAVRYHMYHAFALIITGILYHQFSNNYQLWAARLFIAGIMIFSGSLYLLTTLRIMGKDNFEWLGAITPLGGLCFIAGWLSMVLGIRNHSVYK